MIAYFSTGSDVVVVQMRAESDGEIGDMVMEVHAGEEFAGISYADLIAAQAGKIEFDADGKGAIVKEKN